jgi:hypothetical protein
MPTLPTCYASVKGTRTDLCFNSLGVAKGRTVAHVRQVQVISVFRCGINQGDDRAQYKKGYP